MSQYYNQGFYVVRSKKVGEKTTEFELEGGHLNREWQNEEDSGKRKKREGEEYEIDAKGKRSKSKKK